MKKKGNFSEPARETCFIWETVAVWIMLHKKLNLIQFKIWQEKNMKTVSIIYYYV